MHKRIYCDTNILVDLFDTKRPYHSYSVELLKKLFANERVELFINTDTLSNLFYLLRSYIKLDFDTAIKKLEYIKNSFTIVSSQLEDIEATLALCKAHSFNDYEDAMQYVCALKAKCSLIITNNPKDFKNSSLPIVTSKELSQL